MWLTLRTLWLARLAQALSRSAPRRRPAFRRPVFRPRLEALEDRTVPAAITILGSDLVTSAGIPEVYSINGILSQATGDRSVNLGAGTYSVANSGGTYGTFTVSSQDTVAGTTGALVATGNTIDFDLTQLAAVTASPLFTAGGRPETMWISNVVGLAPGTSDTAYLPAGTYDLFNGANGLPSFGSFTVSPQFTISGTSGALVATGNTIGFDLSQLAAVTVSPLFTAGGHPETMWIDNIVGLPPGTIDTAYLPAGTFYLFDGINAPPSYGSFTVSDQLTISGTSGALVATGNSISFNDCALNHVTITPNPGVGWAVFAVAGFSAVTDTVLIPDGTWTIYFSGATGGAGPATFSVGPNGLSDTELPVSAPLVSLQLTPCAPALTSAARVSSGTTISGTYMGRASTTYR